MNLKHFLMALAVVAPKVLAVTPLAPIARPVQKAIAEAEAMKGASGQEKLAHVVEVAGDAADAAAAAGVHVDPNAVRAAAAHAVSTAVDLTKVHATVLAQVPAPTV